MKLENYLPTFRNVLVEELETQLTRGGLYVPPSAVIESKNYRVLKVGSQVIEVKPGDIVKIMRGIQPEHIGLEKNYLQVPEQQIIGIIRE